MSVFHNIFTEQAERATKEAKQNYTNNFCTLDNMVFHNITNTFGWNPYPETTLRHLPEQFLYFWGRFGAFKEDGKTYVYPCSPAGSLLDNGEYDKYMLYTLNGKSFIKDRDEIVICYDNSRAIPSIVFAREMVEKMGYALSAVDTALHKAMLPAIIECGNESQLKYVTDMLDKINSLKPFLTSVNSSFSNDEIKIHDIFDNRATDVLALWDVYTRYRNMFYVMNGINVVEIQKKERLTEAEGSGNEEISRFTLLHDKWECRIDFSKKFEEKFDEQMIPYINRSGNTIYDIITDNKNKVKNVEMDFIKGINTNVVGGEDDGD